MTPRQLESGADAERRDLRTYTPPPLAVVGLIVGLLAVFSPVILSGLEVTFAGLGDPRLVNFTLEHGYRWLLGHAAHADFWSPPIFYPHSNVSAYTDVLIGVGPFYWVWRSLGFEPDTAFLFWNLTVWSLNYIAVYVLLRRHFRVGVFGATMGSLLFAFGAPRTLNLAHAQLVPNFYAVIVIMAVFRIFGARTNLSQRRVSIAAGGLGFVLQAYTAFYPFYFLALALGLSGVWALVVPESRSFVLKRVRDNWFFGLATVVVSALLVWPLAAHYLQAQSELGVAWYPAANVPRPVSWLLMGPRNSLYGWLQAADGPYAQLSRPFHSNGIGFVTLLTGLVGLWWGRRRLSVRLTFLVVLSIFVLSVTFPGGFSLWRFAHEYLPGASALRATGRIAMVLLLLGAVGIAFFYDRLASRRRFLAVGALLLICGLEQWNRTAWIAVSQSRERISAVAARVDPQCRAFLLVSRGGQPDRFVHDDAAWVSLATGIPTVNGRYGHSPPNWPLRDVHIDADDDEPRIRAALGHWLRLYGMEAERVCLVET